MPNRILVAEDDPSLREVLVLLLQEHGYEVMAVEHGGDALELLRGGLEPDLVMTDLTMPVVNGWELVAAMQIEFPHLPVLVVSAMPPPHHPPGVPVMTKPVQATELLDMIATTIGSRACPRPSLPSSSTLTR